MMPVTLTFTTDIPIADFSVPLSPMLPRRMEAIL